MKKEYWFVNKTYGWGWTPATWQGWLATLLYLLVILGSVGILSRYEPDIRGIIGFFVLDTVATVLLLVICVKTGETPEWRWGKKK